MSRCITASNISAGPWIKHFEQQAVRGGSGRYFTNRNYILVEADKDKTEILTVNKAENKTDKISTGGEAKEKVPPLISPVQQTVEQAEAEVKRDKDSTVHNELQSDQVPVLNIVNKKRIKVHPPSKVKQKSKKRLLVKDIFSK